MSQLSPPPANLLLFSDRHWQPYVLEAVRRAEKKILDARLNHEYAGIQGT